MVGKIKRSLVIGGTRGIGGQVAAGLAARGDHVTTLSRAPSENPNHLQWDITNDCSDVLGNIEPLDYVVFAHRYRGDDTKEELNVTIDAVDHVVRVVSPRLTNSASVVFIGSVSSHLIFDNQPAVYHAARAGIEGLMRYYAVDYGKHGIRFNCVLPYTVVKPENVEFFREGTPTRTALERVTPLGRLGHTEDLVNLISFLCSDKSSFITGNCITVDGGLALVSQHSIVNPHQN